MKTRLFMGGSSIKSLAVLMVMGLLSPWFAACHAAEPPEGLLPPLLIKVQQDVQKVLQEVDRNLAASAGELARTGLDSPQARSVLAGMCPNGSFPFLVDCCTVSSGGRMLLVEPAAFKASEGADISGQEQIVRLHATKQPVMSRTITMVEGFKAIDLEQPVFSGTGEFLGSVSVLIRSEALFASLIPPAIKGYPVNMCVMETNGFILYDGHEGEIGGNLFQDPTYKAFQELQDLGARMAVEPFGDGTYTYYQGGPGSPVVHKRTSWTTVGLHGTQWRLMLIHEADKDETAGSGSVEVSDVPGRLGKLCEDTGLQKALAARDRAAGLAWFKKFFDDTPGLYSVQWIDPKGRNRFGYPPENSIEDASIRKHKLPTDRPFLEAIAGEVPTTVELPLGEGGMGIFYLHPIHSGKQYLGMVYAIRLKNPDRFQGGASDLPTAGGGKKFRIGYVEGGAYQGYQEALNALIEGLAELGWLNKDGYPRSEDEKETRTLWSWLSGPDRSKQLEFVRDAYWSAGWDSETRKRNREIILDRLNTRKDIDLILALGTRAGLDMANDLHAVPVMVLSTSNPIAAGIIKSAEDSGRDHVHAKVDPTQHERQVRLFHDIVPFKKLGMAYQNTPAGRTFAAVSDVKKVGLEQGFEVMECYTEGDDKTLAECEESVVRCCELLAPDVDAFYVTEQRGVTVNNLPRMLDPLFRHRVVSFAQGRNLEVKYGVAVSLARQDFRELGKFQARTLTGIARGAKPRDMPQVLIENQGIAVNLESAKKVGLKLPLDALAGATEIYERIEDVRNVK